MLKNKSAQYDDRNDATMDLGKYDGPEVEGALLNELLDESEYEDLVNSEAESLSQVWSRRDFEMTPWCKEFTLWQESSLAMKSRMVQRW